MFDSTSLKLKIGSDGITCLAYSVIKNNTFLAVGTCGGRVRM